MNRTDRTNRNTQYSTFVNGRSRKSVVFLYSYFGVPLVLLWSPYGDSEDARYIHGGSSELSRRCYGARSEVYVLGNIGGVANEAGFNGSRTCVHGRMNLCCGKGIVVASKTKEL